MLCSLSIRNVVLIDRLDLEFSAGFSVLTGETGARQVDSARFSRVGVGQPGGNLADPSRRRQTERNRRFQPAAGRAIRFIGWRKNMISIWKTNW